MYLLEYGKIDIKKQEAIYSDYKDLRILTLMTIDIQTDEGAMVWQQVWEGYVHTHRGHVP